MNRLLFSQFNRRYYFRFWHVQKLRNIRKIPKTYADVTKKKEKTINIINIVKFKKNTQFACVMYIYKYFLKQHFYLNKTKIRTTLNFIYDTLLHYYYTTTMAPRELNVISLNLQPSTFLVNKINKLYSIKILYHYKFKMLIMTYQ